MVDGDGAHNLDRELEGKERDGGSPDLIARCAVPEEMQKPTSHQGSEGNRNEDASAMLYQARHGSPPQPS
jgi:hypothetical protein